MDDSNMKSKAGAATVLEIARPVRPPELPIRPVPLAVSGLYVWTPGLGLPLTLELPAEPTPEPRPWKPPEWPGRFPRGRQELRLDVDGLYPLLMASGTVVESLATNVHWIARLTATGPDSWTGTIWYKDGAVGAFPYTDVQIRVTHTPNPNQRIAIATFSGGGGSPRTRPFRFRSPYHHPVDFEFDFAEGEAATTIVDTCAHPNRPATLPCENLTLQTVYQRAGFDVTTSPNAGQVPIVGAGPGARWSNQEMHDAMQTYWSRFAATAQWAFWIFFASLHEMGTSLGGIMFDDIGPNHRQGTAIFNDSFIATAPAGDPNPAAWVQRMIFWTAAHEMGHAFNLAHSWQKSLGAPWGTPWIPLTDEPEARSFMNYPYRVSGGQTAFFADFEYRFSNGELLFVRHAPARFVQMGNADWFDHHGFEQASVSPEPTLRLELRVNRDRPIFEFMEPVVLELKLTNVSSEPQLVDESLLSTLDTMTVVLKKDGKRARQLIPYAQYCCVGKKRSLAPTESIYESLFVSAGRNGWDIAEPGDYTVQLALHLDGEDVVSSPLRVRVTPPRGYDEELLAQDFFSDDVGRIISFDGSQVLTDGNDTLRQVAEKLGGRRVAVHALLALGEAQARDYKLLTEDPNGPRKMGIEVRRAKADEARRLLSDALVSKPAVAVETCGHIDYKWYVDRFSDWLAKEGATEEAAAVQDALYKTLSARQVRGRPVLEAILNDIKKRRDGYKAKTR